MCPAGVVPALRHGDRLPGVLVEPTGAVVGIVARAEAPRPADRVDIIAGHDRGRRVASGGTRLDGAARDRKSTRLNSSHQIISYAVFCLKKKNSSTLSGNSRPAR